MCPASPAFLRGFWRLSVGPHAFVANALPPPSERLFGPWFVILPFDLYLGKLFFGILLRRCVDWEGLVELTDHDTSHIWLILVDQCSQND